MNKPTTQSAIAEIARQTAIPARWITIQEIVHYAKNSTGEGYVWAWHWTATRLPDMARRSGIVIFQGDCWYVGAGVSAGVLQSLAF